MGPNEMVVVAEKVGKDYVRSVRGTPGRRALLEVTESRTVFAASRGLGGSGRGDANEGDKNGGLHRGRLW